MRRYVTITTAPQKSTNQPPRKGEQFTTALAEPRDMDVYN